MRAGRRTKSKPLDATPNAMPSPVKDTDGEVEEERETVEETEARFPVVGIGASTGGLVAFEAF